MLEGLLAALALFCGSPADQVREPTPLVSLDMSGGDPSVLEHCDMIFVDVAGNGTFAISTSGLYRTAGTTTVSTRDLPALLRSLAPREGERCSRAVIRAGRDIPYTEVLKTMTMLRYNGFTRIALMDMDASE